MSIKTWQERTAERGIGSCEARDEELIELRAHLAAKDKVIKAAEAKTWREAASWIERTDLGQAPESKRLEYAQLLLAYYDAFRAKAKELETIPQ